MNKKVWPLDGGLSRAASLHRIRVAAVKGGALDILHLFIPLNEQNVFIVIALHVLCSSAKFGLKIYKWSKE